MALLKLKKEQPVEEKSNEDKEVKEQKPDNSAASVQADLTRLKAQVDSFAEVRKVFGERFSRVNEMIGELRGMIMETNKDLQQIQVKTVKAVDLVDAVQPDKLMTQIRKQDVKIEVLKANIESNEARMDTILKELKDLRSQVNSFRGIEQIVKLSEEVKDELIDIRKVKSIAERHSDKIESIFIDFQKRVRELSELEDNVKGNAESLKKLVKDFDDMKIKVMESASKKEVDKLISTSREFEKHTTKAIELLNRVFVEFEEGFTEKFDSHFKKMDTLKGVLEELTKESPELEKSVKELEDLMRQRVEEEQRKKKKAKGKGFFGWVKSKVSKKAAQEKAESEEEVDVEAIGEAGEAEES